METIINYLLRIPGLIFVFSFKGFSQAFIANKLGDPTPKHTGRLTMNPLAHIDPIGFLFMLIFRIGWTKPLDVRKTNFKKIKRDTAIFYATGPLSCFLGGFFLVLVSNILILLLIKFFPGSQILFYLTLVFQTAASLSVFLGVFYLLPLPGLDGYNFIVNFVPYKYYSKIYTIEKYSTYIFLGFILLMRVTTLGDWILDTPADLILRLFNWILGFILLI